MNDMYRLKKSPFGLPTLEVIRAENIIKITSKQIVYKRVGFTTEEREALSSQYAIFHTDVNKAKQEFRDLCNKVIERAKNDIEECEDKLRKLARYEQEGKL